MWEPVRQDDARSPAARRAGLAVVVVLLGLFAWVTLRGHHDHGEQRRSKAMALLREGLDRRDPDTLAAARREFLDASTGAGVRSEGLLLASVTEQLRARVAGEPPDEAAPGARDPVIRQALDLLAAARYEDARRALAAAQAAAPSSTLRFHVGLVDELLAYAPAPPRNRQAPGDPIE